MQYSWAVSRMDTVAGGVARRNGYGGVGGMEFEGGDARGKQTAVAVVLGRGRKEGKGGEVKRRWQARGQE
jgi:hypothetical protein